MNLFFNIMELLFFWQDIYREKPVTLRNTQKLSVESQFPKVLDKKNIG